MMRTIQALACAVCLLVAIQTAGSQFSVARISPLLTSSYPRLVYEVDLIGDGNFDLTTSTYRVQETGLYWIHISTGIPPSTEADVRLNLPYYQPDVVCAHSSYTTGNDTTSRSIITNLTKDYILYANTIYAINSGSLKDTSFGGFSIGAYMSQTVAFFVGKTSPQTEIGNILFDDIVVDTDGAWNKGDRIYKTKTPGLYVISFVTCLQRNIGHTVQAMINGIANTAIYITDTVHKAEDTASITFLVSLPANSYLSLALVTGSIYSDIRHLTALGGFLYSPPAANSVAWQLYRSTELTVPTDPVSFDIVAIDTASEWDQVNNKYTVTTAGVYCINLSAGMVANNGVELNLVVNGYTEMGLHRSSVDHNGFDTRGRSLIGRFAAGSELRVALASFRLYSNDLRQTSFSGFRIY